MNILIISHATDLHAVAVAVALHKLGANVVLWSAPDLVGDNPISVAFSETSQTITLNRQKKYASDYFDLVWHRRSPRFEMPESLHQDDIVFAKQENEFFYNQIWSMCSSKTKWLPDPSNIKNLENKIYQLNEAKSVGLRIPNTLVSNDPEEIVKFIGEKNKYGYIYKPFKLHAWRETSGYRSIYTNMIHKDDIINNDTVRIVPGIYQERIEKSFEVRATFFGDDDISVKINSSIYDSERQDWRASTQLMSSLELYQLPRETRDLCNMYLHRIGADMGCFDFIVTEDGEFVFLEVNQQGQFLWIEHALPSSGLLLACAKFLWKYAGGDAETIEMTTPDAINISEISRSELRDRVSSTFIAERFVDLSSL